ncbi:MAG: hypothetical protein ABIT68_08700 [Sphingomicrobium sp.]
MDMDFGSLIPVVAIMTSFGFGWIWLRYQELKLQKRQLECEADEQSDEKRRLQERLAVLERIATDRGLQTADQIDALLKQPEIAASDGKGHM